MSCKSDVRAAFKKLDGFVAIEFQNGDAAGQQKIVLGFDTELTQEQLTESLGKKASKYVVKGIEKKG